MKRALVAGIPLAILLLVVAAWLLDVRAHDGEALRNVQVAGRDVGGLRGDALETAVREAVARYETAEIVITTPDGDIELTAAEVGLEIDVEASVERALDEGRSDPLPLRPVRWLQSLVSDRDVGVVATVEGGKLRTVVAERDPTERRDPVEPGILGDEGEIAVVLGENGEGIDADEAADAIVESAASGSLPITVDLEPHAISPRFSRGDAEALAEEARALTSDPITVSAGESEAEVPTSTLRSWLRSEPGEGDLELALDDEEVLDDLAALLADAGTKPKDATFTVDGGRPAVVPGIEGTTCCAAESVGYLVGAVKAGHGGPVRLPLETTPPDVTTDELRALEVTEEIGSFTTNHKSGESRVTNIHRMADLVRGVVLEPGEQFSINDHVGKRTTENGFVVGGVIENGVFAESVGGGVSQFATTTFNAAFFAGLDIVEYQSHSLYISRYPYGREATLSFPKPDLIIRNNTPFGVLIWTRYTNTSITVALYSTRHVSGAQTAQTETPVGDTGCKRVTTERTRTYVDGTTKVDKFHAVYRPEEGVKCR